MDVLDFLAGKPLVRKQIYAGSTQCRIKEEEEFVQYEREEPPKEMKDYAKEFVDKFKKEVSRVSEHLL